MKWRFEMVCKPIVRCAGSWLIVLAFLSWGPVTEAQPTVPPLERKATVNALSMATRLGSEYPVGEIEEISCSVSLSCGRCHTLSTEFAQAAASDDSWVPTSSCKLPEVREGKAGRVWINGLTVMSDTLGSIQGATLYLRDRAPEGYRLPWDFFSRHDLSFTLSQTPLVARGTSAGLAFLLAAFSAASGVPIMPQVAVTGAISPDGKVGPVGSILQKIAAADQLGLTTVIIPASNAPELSLLPSELTRRIRIILADNAEQALFHALGQAGPRGAEYDAMYQSYLVAIALESSGDHKGALKLFSQVADAFPEDYSLRVWIQYLESIQLTT